VLIRPQGLRLIPPRYVTEQDHFEILKHTATCCNECVRDVGWLPFKFNF